MKMRTGTMVGKNDSRFNGIRVGDRLRDNESGAVGHVDNYGSLCFPDRNKISLKKWNGVNYTLVEEDTMDIVPEESSPKAAPITVEVAEAEDAVEMSTTDWERAARFWKRQYEEVTIDKFSPKSMVDELRRRGYDVKCTRTIIEEL